MAKYRRVKVAGGTYFFTLVTCDRRPMLTSDLARPLLRESIRQVRSRLPFSIEGFVLLPDHLHTIWTLPPGDTDYPTRWRQIKALFTRDWLASGGSESSVSISRATAGGRGVWQRRYYERTIRDEEELRRRLDYIHINPVKHGHCKCAIDWEWSSFHRYVQLGMYQPEWGGAPEFYGDEWQECE